MKRATGFTLVELVMVIVILGILAAVAIPRMDTSIYRALEFHDKVVSALRYAQKTATSHRRRVCVAFSASSVTLTIARANPSAACDDPLVLPGGNSNIVQSSDTANAIFSSVPADFVFLPDGSVLPDSIVLPDGSVVDRILKIADQPDIAVVGKTGYVQ